MINLPNAEDLPFWKTGKSTPDKWLDQAEKVIAGLGGNVTLRAQGTNDGRKAYLLDFQFPPERFRAIWPVLPVRTDNPANRRAADRQAATMLYHDVKTRALRATIFGPRLAFFEFLILPDGQTTVGHLGDQELITYTPTALLPKG